VALGMAARAGQGGEAGFLSWESATNGSSWMRAALPLRAEAPSLSARGIFHLPAGTARPVLFVEATACGATVFINKVLRLQRDVCAGDGVLERLEVSALGFALAGPNLVEVELRSRGPETALLRADLRIE
jgi:hypothetical protein